MSILSDRGPSMFEGSTVEQSLGTLASETEYEIVTTQANLPLSPLSFLQRMMAVTEIATIPLSAGSNVREPGSEATRIWQHMLATISQQDGCQKVYSGLQHEGPNTAQLFIVWDTLAHHENFQTLPVYRQMLESLEPILGGSPQLVHFELECPNDLAAAICAPVTELATLFLPGEMVSFDDNMNSFAAILTERAEGFMGCTFSWIIEDVEHGSLGPGVKGKAYILAIGWSSISAHAAFKQTSAFQKGLDLFKDALGSEIHHTTFWNTA
ncbi:hypothetical protein QM012_002232 [Aureobasidium pullulans]|uniref:ABM domain-containing protein n=1 Tax=Aureobasidium pullulans TaxID=5580 RepID=A0ABR0TBC3_AURPU